MNALLLAAAMATQCGPNGCTVPTTRLVSVEVLAGQGIGSGTIARATTERALVLTARHMLRGRPTTLVRDRAGIRYRANLLGIDSASDLAAVEIVTPPSLLAHIRATSPGIRRGQTWELEIASRPAERIVMYGFGGESRRGLAILAGRLLNPQATLEGDVTYALRPELGDSGGGLWSTDGYFAGVLSARDGFSHRATSQAYVVGPSAIRRFLRQECCLLRLAGRALLGRAPVNRSTLDVQIAQAPTRALEVLERADAGIVAAPMAQVAPPPEADQLPAPVRERRPVVVGPREALPNIDVAPIDPNRPITHSVVVFQDNANGQDLGAIRAELRRINALMDAGITFAIPQLNGLQKRRTVRLGESLGFEMNAQGPAMEAMPTTAPNQ